ncbi:MAG TPA: hypothetical protein VFI39_00645 [Gemmatimonadales bacterium]|nr:hypothetical protein [Gemmatimonadales bacterium]
MRHAIGVAILALAAAPLAAQGNAFYSNPSATTGVQFRSYQFGAGAVYDKVSQFAIPIAVAIPVSPKLAIDIGTYYGSTTATPTGGAKQTLSGLTDAQIRGAYVFSDALVATLVLNLPTGTKFDSTEAQAAGASASNWLLFPINSFANGFSATAGVAGTRHLGSWNFGLALSGRLNSSFKPVSGDSLSYKPGFEGRARIGADRLIGQSRLTLGLTFSTYGDDAFGTGAGAQQRYSPGKRFIGEASLTGPGLGGSVTGYVWDYFRAAGDTAGVSTGNRENILTAGLAHRIPLSTTTTLESVAEARILSQEGGGSGILVGVGTGVRMRLSDRFNLVPNARVDLGNAKFPLGGSASVTGISASALLQYNF